MKDLRHLLPHRRLHRNAVLEAAQPLPVRALAGQQNLLDSRGSLAALQILDKLTDGAVEDLEV